MTRNHPFEGNVELFDDDPMPPEQAKAFGELDPWPYLSAAVRDARERRNTT